MAPDEDEPPEHKEDPFGTAYLQIQTTNRDKQRLKSEVSKSEKYQTMSQLVREAVTKEISGRFDDREQGNEETIQAVLETKDEVEKVQQEISEARDEIISQSELEQVLETLLTDVINND